MGKNGPISDKQWAASKRAKSATLQPPPELDTDGRAEWDRLIGQLNCEGRIANLDLGALATYCQAWARFLQCERVIQRDGMTYPLLDKHGEIRCYMQRPEVAIGNRAAQLLSRLGNDLGLTPGGRARMNTKASNLPQKRNNPKSTQEKLENVVDIKAKYNLGGSS